ncbi:UNVERIFIED_CONTAM: regulatory LuxR family protein [Williamsia faeni]
MRPNATFVGRDPEVALLSALCTNVHERGAAIVIEGDPGVGKTALVEQCSLHARERGLRVLRVSASPAEAGVPYAALHLLLHPLHALFETLPTPQRNAVEVAFGLADVVAAPSPLMAGLATLTLLTDAAAEQPLLVIAEDVHWFDSASRWALEMAARRICDDPVVIIMTTRGSADTLPALGISQMYLEPLSEAESTELIGTRADIPAGRAVRAVLERAAGNPLALLELDPPELSAGAFDVAPVTRRLEATFAGRFADLAAPIRLAVLAMALGDSPSPEQSSRIVADIVGKHLDPAWIDTVTTAGLAVWSPEGLRFRHPLVRAAVTSASRPSERSAVLQALVRAHGNQPSQTLWWRVKLAGDMDAALCVELTELARASAHTGDHQLAARAFERAAELTDDPIERASRRLDAAEAAFASGACDIAARLITHTLIDTDVPAVHGRAQWLREILAPDDSALSRGDFGPALAAIDTMRTAAATDDAIASLVHLASIMWDHSTDTGDPERIQQALSNFDLPAEDPRALFLDAVTDPATRADHVLATVSTIDAQSIQDSYSLWLLGHALNVSGEHDLSWSYASRAVAALRAAGDVALLPHALMGASWTSYLRGHFDVGRELADECLRLATDLGNNVLAVGARIGLAWFDAIDGSRPDIGAITGQSPAAADMLHARNIRASLIGSDAATALVTGHPRQAHDLLRPFADPSDPVYGTIFGVAVLPDIIEAALTIGDRDHALTRVAHVRELNRSWHAPLIDSVLRFADIALADESDLAKIQIQLVDGPPSIPYFQARAELLLGIRLRRLRRVDQSRQHLTRALKVFDDLPAPAWSERCRDALRATGERLANEPLSRTHVLTRQELRIAALAANGLSNRSIAEQLFLSPRTIAAHLSAAYRKLGITARGQLPLALADDTRPADTPPEQDSA